MTSAHLSDQVRLAALSALQSVGTRVSSQRIEWRVDALARRLASGPRGPSRLVVASRDGRHFQLDPREPQYHMGLLGSGNFEPETSKVLHVLTEPGDTVIDIGANFGWFTSLLSRRVGPTGQVHAFEPLPSTHDVLRQTLERNGCRNVRPNAMALSDAPGELTMHYFPDQPHGNASLYAHEGWRAVTATVPVTTLDRYAVEAGILRCTVIKCDAEGAELNILRGGRTLLERDTPAIAIELNTETSHRAGYEACDLLTEIAARGDYTFDAIEESGHLRRIADIATFRVDGYCNVVCVLRGSPQADRLETLRG
jgi:FkbM family methyltransferase